MFDENLILMMSKPNSQPVLRRSLLKLSVLMSLCLSSVASGQSLVVNHGLDNNVGCPSTYSQIGIAPDWSSPTLGSPDYFHPCATSPIVQVPANSFGSQVASEGVAYAGIVVLSDFGFNAVEYIQAPLKAPLLPGVVYDVSFDVSLADNSTLAIDRLDAYLGAQEVDFTTLRLLSLTPQVLNTNGVITDKIGWTTVSGTYVATGVETHITIGNFDGNATNKMTVLTTPPMGSAYYYVDNVVVQEQSPEPTGLYIVSNTNELMRVDITTTLPGNFCPAVVVGVTEEPSTSTVHRIRGLAVADGKLFGMTREGFFVNVNPSTGETHQLHSIQAGTPPNEFWSGLAFDGTNKFYTSDAFGVHDFVSLELGDGTTGHGILEDLVGQINFGGSTIFQALGLDFYPATAPLTPPSSNGTHPDSTNLYAVIRNTANIQPVDPTTGAISFDIGGGALTTPNPQATTFHPTTGELYIIHDSAQITRYAFTTPVTTLTCNLPFGIIESVGGGNDTYGWGGMAFLESPAATGANALEAFKLCVANGSTGIGWSWQIAPFVDNVEPLSTSATAADIAAALRDELVRYGFTSYIDSADDKCLTVMLKPGTDLVVGAYDAVPNCTVNANGNGCTVNPVLMDYSLLPPRPGTTSPFGFIIVPALSPVWGLPLLGILMVYLGYREQGRRGNS